MLKTKLTITRQPVEFTRSQIDEDGLYETANEYLRNLIPQDMERSEAKTWLSLREELMPGMKADRSAFVEVSAADIINRNKNH